MVFSRTWDSAYEANPPDTQSAKQGAARLTEIKVDVRERFEIDHKLDGDADDGKHVKVTFDAVLGAKPTLLTGEGALYTKTVSGKAEIFYEDSAGAESQLTSGGSVTLTTAADLGGVLEDLDTLGPPTADNQYIVSTGAGVLAYETHRRYPIVTTAADKTFALTDAGALVNLTGGDPKTFTVPPNSSVAFPIGTVIGVTQDGAGQLTLAEGAGVTINVPTTQGLLLREQYSMAALIQDTIDTWRAVGDLKA